MPHYAHTLDGRPETDWELLSDHEQNVATLCSDFLSRIHPDLAPWGKVLGRWHDLGKYSREFQEYLQKVGNDACCDNQATRTPHAFAGAQHAAKMLGRIGQLLAYCIAGHHAGLHDWVSISGDARSGLAERLGENFPSTASAPAALLAPPELILPALRWDTNHSLRPYFQISMLARLCFSALCDADFLATESFMSPDQSDARRSSLSPTIDKMAFALDEYLDQLRSDSASTVNAVRRDVLESCRSKASISPGLFSLNVPTGGGKTLSSLAFALHHARLHNLDRIIYAIPFTTIVEQTVDTFRAAFKDVGDAKSIVLEHHSNLDLKEESVQSRLASENWDAPLIVTTNVQFFESLFANRTSRCRKVHRIAHSVIILDEAQTIPVHLLEPCLEVLRELCRVFGSTVVLCTATQPAIEAREDFPIGLEDVRPIIDDPAELSRRMKRVDVQTIGIKTDDHVLDELTGEHQFLLIVNTRPHASRLFTNLRDRCGGKGLFHLSTFMCAAHRASVIKKVRARLDSGRPCRVVSTQLIEAGVDIDFPVVYRSMAGLDSIAQAAGRCNRNGKLPIGKVRVFEPHDIKLHGLLKATANIAKEVIPDHVDILSIDAVEDYFRGYYWQQSAYRDKAEVMPCLNSSVKLHFQFRTAAERFRMIDETGRSVFVPWGERGNRLEERIRRAKVIDQNLRRNVQRYLVPIYENVFNSLIGSDIDISVEGIPILLNRTLYDDQLGICLDRAGQHDIGSLIFDG